MYQAITTKYLSATNHRGERVKATAQAGSVTVSWDYELNTEANHKAAAKALSDKMGWDGSVHGVFGRRYSVWHSGATHQDTYVHVLERRLA